MVYDLREKAKISDVNNFVHLVIRPRTAMSRSFYSLKRLVSQMFYAIEKSNQL